MQVKNLLKSKILSPSKKLSRLVGNIKSFFSGKSKIKSVQLLTDFFLKKS